MTIIQHPSADAGFLRTLIRHQLRRRSTPVITRAQTLAVELYRDGHSGHRAAKYALAWADRQLDAVCDIESALARDDFGFSKFDLCSAELRGADLGPKENDDNEPPPAA